MGKGETNMKTKIEKECTGYMYTGVTDNNRQVWSVTTDYINDKIYLSEPSDDQDLGQIKAYGQAIVKAVGDMRRENNGGNRQEI